MRERPILFSGPMVRAILDGTKTQTRRLVDPKWQHFSDCCPLPGSIMIENGTSMDFPGRTPASFIFHDGIPIRDCEWQPVNCPHGGLGDRLWVRETFCVDDNGHEEWPVYKADDIALPVRPKGCGVSRWRPSIHMPRWTSRITLEITGVRVERLQGISYDDARAEGWSPTADDGKNPNPLDPKSWFLDLWRQIYGPGSWDANPWVWVVEFERVDGAKGA